MVECPPCSGDGRFDVNDIATWNYVRPSTDGGISDRAPWRRHAAEGDEPACRSLPATARDESFESAAGAFA